MELAIDNVVAMDDVVVQSTREIFSVAISNDSKYIATSEFIDHGKVRMMDTKTREPVRVFEGHKCNSQLVKFSLDDQYIVTASDDKTAKVWCVHTGEEICTLKGHIEPIHSIDMSPDNRFVLTASYDGSCKLWDLHPITNGQKREGMPTQTIKATRTFKGYTSAVAFANEAKSFLSGSHDSIIRLWCVNSGNVLRIFTGHSSHVECLCISKDNRYIVSGSDNRYIESGSCRFDKSAMLWDFETGEKLKTYKGHLSSLVAVSISSDNAFVITASVIADINIWDTDSGDLRYILRGKYCVFASISLSSDDKLLLTGSYDGTVRMTDLSLLPDTPGMSWKILKPYIVARWLHGERQQLVEGILNSSSISNNDDYAVVRNTISKYSSLTMEEKKQQVLHSLITIDVDDIFRHIISLLISSANFIKKSRATS